jgi:methylmalonyl-CoA epimerase
MGKKRAFGLNIAVKNLEEAVENFKGLLEIEPKMLGSEDFAFPGLKGASFNLNGFLINLITSIEENTSVAGFLEKNGEGFFLFSLEVDDIEGEVERLKKLEINLVPQEIIDTDSEWGKVIFVHPKSLHGVQVELIQPVKVILD